MDMELFLDVVARVPDLFRGAGLTLNLVGVSAVFGLLLAVPLAAMRASRNPLLWVPAYGYIHLFRGTPLMVQLFLIYYGLGQFEGVTNSFLWIVLRDAYWCAIISFSLNTGAYTAEILRGGIEAVPFGEVEAARATGMSRFQVYRHIVIPRAFRIAFPAYGNEIILMIKASAIVSLVTLFDLMGMARQIFSRTFAIEIFLYAAILYLIIAFVFVRVWSLMERRLNRHLHDAPLAVEGHPIDFRAP